MIVSHIMAMGVPPQAAQTIGGGGATGIISNGSTQATATQLPASQNILAAAPAGGVKLPPCEMGNEVWVRNDSGNNQTIYVFETAGVSIAPAGSSVILATGKTVVFKAATSTVWLPLLTA